MKNLGKSVIATAVMFAMGGIAGAQASTMDDLTKAFKESSTKINFRYRLETVDQDGFAEDATASTLKTRLTWKSGSFNGFKLNVEVDDVTAIGGDTYNSTANGNTAYPVVADPEGTDVNQANIGYFGKNYSIIAGRQRILHNGQRFVGGVGWRQNEQTYDGYRLQYKPTESVSVDYSYVFNVNRIFGPSGAKADLKGHLHLANVKYSINKDHKLAAYAYLLDFDTAAAISTDTFGFDYSGNFGGVKAKLSYATQSDTGENPNDFSADYWNAELGTKLGDVNLAAGIEVLGSDNGVGFSTPLATLHKFQGFADKFLGTPGTGIEDVYIKASTKINGIGLTAFYHDFSAETGGADLGSEIDLVASYKFNKQVSGVLKYAAYDADNHATDTNKLWAMVNVSF